MKSHLFIVLLILPLLVACSCNDDNDNVTPDTDNQSKVLIDTDMVEGFDDGMALMMLLSATNVDVVGVTTVTGNTWVQEGVAYAIRQMEICRKDSVPIIVGSEYPLREGRLSTLKNEVLANPGPDYLWLGAVEYDRVDDWRNFYVEHYGEQPSLSPTYGDAADFIISMLHKYPGELTLLAIGPCTNIAKALMKEPGVERLAREIVYMGGSYFIGGNTTPYSEYNVFFDPEATALCLRTPFARQTIASLDVCNNVIMDKNRYDDMCSKIKDERLLQIFHNCFHYGDFQEHPDVSSCIWDVISAAVTIDRNIVKSSKTVRVDVQDDPSKSEYGRTFVTDNTERQYARLLTDVDADRIWDMVYKVIESRNEIEKNIRR